MTVEVETTDYQNDVYINRELVVAPGASFDFPMSSTSVTNPELASVPAESIDSSSTDGASSSVATDGNKGKRSSDSIDGDGAKKRKTAETSLTLNNATNSDSGQSGSSASSGNNNGHSSSTTTTNNNQPSSGGSGSSVSGRTQSHTDSDSQVAPLTMSTPITKMVFLDNKGNAENNGHNFSKLRRQLSDILSLLQHGTYDVKDALKRINDIEAQISDDDTLSDAQKEELRSLIKVIQGTLYFKVLNLKPTGLSREVEEMLKTWQTDLRPSSEQTREIVRDNNKNHQFYWW